MLEAAALMGMPMRPEHVQDLMRSLNQPKIACTHPDESRRGDGPGHGCLRCHDQLAPEP
jgi:hypothetical protein